MVCFVRRADNAKRLEILAEVARFNRSPSRARVRLPRQQSRCATAEDCHAQNTKRHPGLRQSAEHFRKFNGDDDRGLERTDQGKRCDRRVRTAGLAMTEARTAIAFHDVSKSYGNASPVLDRVSLEVREREFLAVVGPSGSARKGAQPSYEL